MRSYREEVAEDCLRIDWSVVAMECVRDARFQEELGNEVDWQEGVLGVLERTHKSHVAWVEALVFFLMGMKEGE